MLVMRLAAFLLLVLGLTAGVAGGSASAPGSGSLSIEGARGTIEILGKGPLLGKMGKGSLEIADLSAADQWSPRVNGIPRGKLVTLRGKDVSFRIPAGRYWLLASGSDISIS